MKKINLIIVLGLVSISAFAQDNKKKKKNDLYKKVPKLKQIEDDLNQFAINTAKNILKNNEASINELEIKASQLKKETAKTEKSCSTADKKSCGSEAKSGGCCSSKKAAEKKAE